MSESKTINLKELNENPDNFSDLFKIKCYLIYKITCILDGRCYIGDTTDLYNRLFSPTIGHFTHLATGNNHRYRAIRKFGIENFTIEILSTNIEDNEEMFITEFDSYFNGFNENPTGLFIPRNGKSSSNSLGRIHMYRGNILKYVRPCDMDYFISLGFLVGNNMTHLTINSKESRLKSDETKRINNVHKERSKLHIEQKIGLYSEEAEKNRKITRSLPENVAIRSRNSSNTNLNRSKFNGNLVVEYLRDNELEFNERNFNLNRNKVGKNLKQVPTYNTYLNYDKT